MQSTEVQHLLDGSGATFVFHKTASKRWDSIYFKESKKFLVDKVVVETEFGKC